MSASTVFAEKFAAQGQTNITRNSEMDQIMDLDQSQFAKPALPISNRSSPIKANINNPSHRMNFPPVLTFYLSSSWLNETFGIDAGAQVSFAYDENQTPPIGALFFSGSGTTLVQAGPYSLKANFHGWPKLDAFGYSKRSECPIIEIGDMRVVFHIPPNRLLYNPNTGKWDGAA